MNLITKADDERLKNAGSWEVSCGFELFRDSLRAALEERDKYLAAGLEASDTAISFQATIIKLEQGRDAAFAQLAEKEGQLCRAREQLKVACKWLAGSKWGTIDFERAMHEINAVGSSPCRHEARVKELEHGLRLIYGALGTFREAGCNEKIAIRKIRFLYGELGLAPKGV